MWCKHFNFYDSVKKEQNDEKSPWVLHVKTSLDVLLLQLTKKIVLLIKWSSLSCQSLKDGHLNSRLKCGGIYILFLFCPEPWFPCEIFSFKKSRSVFSPCPDVTSYFPYLIQLFIHWFGSLSRQLNERVFHQKTNELNWKEFEEKQQVWESKKSWFFS